MLLPLAKSAIAVNVAMIILASVAVLLRVVARRKTKQILKADDYVLFGALVIALALCATGIWAGATNLFGTSLFTMSLQTYNVYQKVLRIDALLCYVAFGLVKMSILLFYKRLFPVDSFKLAVNLTIGLTVTFTLAVSTAQLLSQKPYGNGWNLPDNYNPLIDYHPSFDFATFLLATAVLNMSLDVLILALPIPIIRSLHIGSRKRLSVVAIFATGAFCVVASIVRIYWCVRAYQIIHTLREPYKITEVACWNDLWGHIEVCCSIIAACLPTLAPLVPRNKNLSDKFTSFFSTSANEKHNRMRHNESLLSSNYRSPDQTLSLKNSVPTVRPLPTAYNKESRSVPPRIYVQRSFSCQSYDMI